MSCISSKKLPTSSNGSGIAQNRSIWEIVRSLKGSFLDIDFEGAVGELKSREDGLRRENLERVASLREKCDVLESELGRLKVEELDWEEERRRLMRQCEVSDDKLKDLTRELSLMKEKEGSAVKRYSSLHDEVRETDERNKKLITMLSASRGVVEEAKRKLREKEYELEECVGKGAQYDALVKELEEVKGRNLCLEEEKRECNAHLEELRKEKDEKVVLLNRNGVEKSQLEAEFKRVKELLNRNGAEKSQLEAQLKVRGEELEDAVRKYAVLEDQKVKLVEEHRRNVEEKDEKIKKLSKDNLNLERVEAEIVKQKDAKIRELLRDKESLAMEKKKLTENLEQVEERFSKLEKDVIAFLSMDLERSKRFEGTRVENILSGIIKVIDSEENGLTCNAGVEKVENTQQADCAFVTNVNGPKYCSNLEKQSLETVKKALDFKNEAANNTVINIDSDDDDDENSRPVSNASNKRKFPGSNSEQHNDDSLSPKLKMIKSEPAPSKQVKQELSGNDRNYNAAQKGALSGIRRCLANLKKEVSGSRCLSEDNGKKDDGSKYTHGTPKSLSPEVEEFMMTQQKKKQIRKLVCRADMILNLERDDDLCAKAVCALYRQQMALPSRMSGSNLEGSKRFEESDFKRVATLAEFLVDGDPRSKLKKSVTELRRHDSNGLNDCRKLAVKYSDKLIEIYIKRKDPLFSPSSTPSSELQYT